MGFRNHKDPLYYDSKANDRVFIPEVDMKVRLYIYIYPYKQITNPYVCVDSDRRTKVDS